MPVSKDADLRCVTDMSYLSGDTPPPNLSHDTSRGSLTKYLCFFKSTKSLQVKPRLYNKNPCATLQY